ncbi:hypothetical protein DY000_02052770 [Brassica cretica]|uniref:Zinc finger GRF-type domain-containing protein n=1 Tax=Brassica cretica TaxID=69181 RepID=A0ABQ7AGT3_BRACR|nr:hypothetical protein DY000_02052770 [Brassica cretica]
MTHPNEEHNQMKALKTPNEMHGFVADAECGIPTSCPCGGRIINEVSRDPRYQTDFDTLPGRKYFTCINFELRKRVDKMAAEIAELKDKLTRP